MLRSYHREQFSRALVEHCHNTSVFLLTTVYHQIYFHSPEYDVLHTWQELIIEMTDEIPERDVSKPNAYLLYI